MKKSAVDISTVFVDARDGNNSRPYCIIVKTPNPDGPNAWPKFAQVWRVRSSTPEDAEMLRAFLIDRRKNMSSLPNFLSLVEKAQSAGRAAAQEKSRLAYERKRATAVQQNAA